MGESPDWPGVTAITRGQAMTVDEVVQLGGESAPGATEAVIRRLDQRIVVV